MLTNIENFEISSLSGLSKQNCRKIKRSKTPSLTRRNREVYYACNPQRRVKPCYGHRRTMCGKPVFEQDLVVCATEW